MKAFRQVRDELRERLRLWILTEGKLPRERDASAAIDRTIGNHL